MWGQILYSRIEVSARNEDTIKIRKIQAHKYVEYKAAWKKRKTEGEKGTVW